jgi:hypothetical protein
MNKETSESELEDSDVSSFHSDESYETIDSSEESCDSSYDSEDYDSDYSSESYESRFECPHDTDDECTCSFPSDYSRWSRSSSLRDHTDSIFKNLKVTQKDGFPYYPKYFREKIGEKKKMINGKKSRTTIYRKWVEIKQKSLEIDKISVLLDTMISLKKKLEKDKSKEFIKFLYHFGSRIINQYSYLYKDKLPL